MTDAIEEVRVQTLNPIPNPINLNKDLFDTDNDSDDEVVMHKRSSSNKSRNTLKIDSDEDEDDLVTTTRLHQEDKESDDSIETQSGSPKKSMSDTQDNLLKGDLFDDEGSGSDKDSGGVSDYGSSTENDEPNTENALKEGISSKKVKSARERPRRINKADVDQIHSETQRMLREGAVRIPYHQPKSRSLQEFLSMRKQNKLGLQSIRNPSKGPLRKISPNKSLSINKTASSSGDELPDLVVPSRRRERSRTQDTAAYVMSLPDLPKECDDDHDTSTNNADIQDTNNKEDSGVLLTASEDSSSQSLPPDKINMENTVQESTKKQQDGDADNMKYDDIDMSQNQTSTSVLLSSTNLTPKLAGLDLKSFTPHLNGDPDSFIEFDEEETPKADGIDNLKDRLLVHSSKRHHRHRRQQEISTVVKERTEDTQELKIKKIIITIDSDEEEMTESKPGAKLLRLKEKLQEGMKAKREVARAERMQVYEMDNEEGFEGNEDDEGELTDQTDTDVEYVNNDDDEDGGNKDEDEVEDTDAVVEQKIENPFVEDEAVESDDEDEDTECSRSVSHAETNEESTSQEKPVLHKSKTLDLFDDDSSLKHPTSDSDLHSEGHRPFKALSENNKTNNSHCIDNNSLDTEPIATSVKELHSSALVGGQDATSGATSQHHKSSSSRFSDLTMPVEDSQDVYSSNDVLTPRHNHSFDESMQSQLLDSDGLLKATNPVTRKMPKLQLNLALNNSQDASDMDELLGLCSGQFTGDTQTGDQQTGLFVPGKGLFSSMTQTQGMDELVGLCSGQFTAKPQSPGDTQQQQDKHKKKCIIDSDDEEHHFSMLSDHQDSDKENNAFSEDEGTKTMRRRRIRITEDSDDEDNIQESNESIESQKFQGFIRQGKIRKDFVDEEAELSGSEYDSDENLDIDEKDDIMEAEEGDFDAAVGNSEQLRDQVGKAYLKNILDEDKKMTRLYQEMYLPDGDLHSDGQGRTRRFRWTNIDEDDTQYDMFSNEDQELPTNEDEDGEDTRWRLERFEREKWLEEQKKEEGNACSSIFNDENSQLMKMASKAILRGKSKKEPASDQYMKKSNPRPDTPQAVRRFALPKAGSFLKKDRSQLEKISETIKTISHIRGPTNSRNFVFAVLSPSAQEEKKSKPLVRRANSLSGAPSAKKMKLDNNTASQNSIFHHIADSQ